MRRDKYHQLFKLLLIGPAETGKTSALMRYADGIYDDKYDPTIGVGFGAKSLDTNDDKKIKLQIWDAAGQARFRAITLSYYENVRGMLLFVDIQHLADFEKHKATYDFFIGQYINNTGTHVPLQIVISKADLAGTKDIPQLKDAKQILMTWLEGHKELEERTVTIGYCSAKDPDMKKTLDTVFKNTVKAILDAPSAAAPAAPRATRTSTNAEADNVDQSIQYIKEKFDEPYIVTVKKEAALQALGTLLRGEHESIRLNLPILRELYKKLQLASSTQDENTDLAFITKEQSTLFRSAYGKTTTYRKMSDMIALKIEELEFELFKTSHSKASAKVSHESKAAIGGYHYRRGSSFFSSAATLRLKADINAMENANDRTHARRAFQIT